MCLGVRFARQPRGESSDGARTRTRTRWDSSEEDKGEKPARRGEERSDLLRPSCSPVMLSVPVYSAVESSRVESSWLARETSESKARGNFVSVYSLFADSRRGLVWF